MKTTIIINNKPVEIELTAEQVAGIKKATINYTDIKTFEDACGLVGQELEDFNNQTKGLPTDVVAYMKLRVIVAAINGGKIMDYSDTDEYKYYPWFNAVGSSAGFSFCGCGCGRSASGVGSRLCFLDRDRAKYAANQFKSIYNEYINAN